MKHSRLTIFALMIVLIVSACTDENYLKYDTSLSGLYFKKDSLIFSFGVTPITQRTYTLNVPVSLLGVPSSSPRNFEVKLLPLSDASQTQAQEGVQYQIETPCIDADSITGYIPITLLRDGMKGQYPKYERYYLHLGLVEANGFTPTLSAKQNEILLRFDNAIESPNWFTALGDKVWTDDDNNRKKTILGKWHPLKLIKMVEYFHDLEQTMPETYPKMVKLYGENLENIPYGDPYQFSTIFREHIYLRMYQYFSNPANREEILREYPDYFPTYDDFPNPYGETDVF